MTTHEQHLLTQLLHSGQSRGRNNFLRLTACEFVVEHGWWYTPKLLPKHLPRGKQNECFKNAFDLAFDDPDLIYVEGYATLDDGTRVAHAWVTDQHGNAFDSTWPKPGTAYAGVPFNTEFTNLNHVKNEAVICLIDDYLHEWPLLRDLADQPDVWMEKAGRGREKISDTCKGD